MTLRRGLLRASGAAVFTPNLLPNCELWLSASDEQESYIDAGVTLVSADGQAVQQVNDRCSNLDATQATAARRPLNKRNIVNGKSVLRFDGSDDFMTLGNVLNSVFASSDKKFAIICSVANYATSGLATVFAKSADTTLSENQRQILFDISDNIPRFIFYGSTDGTVFRVVSGTTLGGADSVISINYDGSIDTNDALDRVSINVNGVSQTTTLTATAGGLPNIPTGTAHVGIAARVNSAGNASSTNGALDSGQVVVLSNPSASDISQVEAFMMNDWGL